MHIARDNGHFLDAIVHTDSCGNPILQEQNMSSNYLCYMAEHLYVEGKLPDFGDSEGCW